MVECCGSEPEVLFETMLSTNIKRFIVVCPKCNRSFDSQPTEELAGEFWNEMMKEYNGKVPG